MDVLLGLQWGDEGKGKIVDVLAPKYDVVARFQGGPNAGHTLEFDGKKLVLHQIPSGILHSKITNIVGNGVVLDPIIFRKEIEAIKKYDVDVMKNLFISKKCHLIVPAHRILDAASERSRGNSKIGSTLKGIGPAYRDKIGRSGLRVGDVLTSDFQHKYDQLAQWHEALLATYNADKDELAKHFKKNATEYYESFEEIENEFFSALNFLQTLNLIEGEYLINHKIAAGNKILAEGAQGTLLDVDFGSYPFVTSSNTFAGGACAGLGVAPNKMKEVFGIFKAYCTRVGGGPFPTELNEEIGEKMRKIGNEFGSTTGRPRRCGWLDLPALKYAVMINGVTQMFIMKSDVLDDFDEVKVCTAYKLPDGTVTDELPYDLCKTDVEPIYVTLKGWKTNLKAFANFADLPTEFKAYLKFIEDYTKTPIKIVSTGPDRQETIML
jgi:adenylosuccinate synthase